MKWKTVERPGYFGKKKREIEKLFDENYGEKNWRIMYSWAGLEIPRSEALQIYEDAYYEFFKNRTDKLNWLIDNYSDVYDTATCNINSHFDYNVQETSNNHIHDIAIRRSVLRLGNWFKGHKLLEVRGKGTEGEELSPHYIPFHLPELILPSESPYHQFGKVKDYVDKGYWWLNLGIKNSVEEFYQHNKILQVRS